MTAVLLVITAELILPSGSFPFPQGRLSVRHLIRPSSRFSARENGNHLSATERNELFMIQQQSASVTACISPSSSRLVRLLLSTAFASVLCTLSFVATASAAPTITVLLNDTAAGVPWEGSDHMSVAVDSLGNVYAAAYQTNNVAQVAPDGVVSIVIDGTGDGLGNTLVRPIGLTIDASDNVYVCGGGTNNAFKITPGGTITEIIDATGDGAGETLSGCIDTAIDSVGNVYVSGTTTSNVFQITPGGTVTEVTSSAGDGVNNLANPRGLAVDSLDNLYVVGGGSSNVFKRTSGGGISQVLSSTGDGVTGCSSPVDVTVDSSDNIYVPCLAGNAVFRVTAGGVISTRITAVGDGVSGLLNPGNVAIDSDDTIYVSGGSSDNVFSVTTGGTITEIMDASYFFNGEFFDNPHGLALDASNNLFVAERDNDRLLKIEPDLCGNGVVDGGEACDASAADNACCNGTCDGVAADATPCSDDSNTCTDDFCDGASAACIYTNNTDGCDDGLDCTTGDACATGVCEGAALDCNDGQPCTADSCIEGVGCSSSEEPTPVESCQIGLKSLFLIKNNADSSKNQLLWKLAEGEAFDQAAIGDVAATEGFTLCVYDQTAATPSLATSLSIDPGVLWADKAPKGVLYKDKTALMDGVTIVKLKAGAAGKTSVQVKAKGVNVPVPALADVDTRFDQDPSVIVQLIGDAGLCLSSEFTASEKTKNSESLFKDKHKQ
jgi:hypothetical protein